jgi:sugar lactone lactonase YvrE
VNDQAELFVDSRCELAEGPFWHPILKRLFWFDILNNTLLSANAEGHLVDRFTFKDNVAAAGVIDADRLAIAQAGALLDFSMSSDASKPITELTGEPAGNRTNDSRVHPSGAFWIGTMSRKGRTEPKVGGVYHYRAGTLTKILTERSIPNATCFTPDGRRAYFTHMGDVILTCETDPATGLPVSEWVPFFSAEGMGEADGAVVDSEGYVWNARWNGSCLLRISPEGKVVQRVDLPVSRVTCPAFGGDDLKTLYITTAREHMTPEELETEPLSGGIFSIRVDVAGQPEPLIQL